jgi:hypothetical protein
VSTSTAIQDHKTVIYKLAAIDQPMTVRQIYYRLVANGTIPKTELAYKCLARWVKQMRLDGDMPWGWIEDSTRRVRQPLTFTGPDDALFWLAKTYRRDLWDDQPSRVEIWCEKDALAGVLFDVTSEYDVPLMVVRGFASVTFLHDAANAIAASAKSTMIYYFGDHDPSGAIIESSVEHRLREFAPDAVINFKRAAVTPAQIKSMRLLTRPTKASAHSRGFKGESVELDAIPPATLRTMVRECIERHINAPARARALAAQERERVLLRG